MGWFSRIETPIVRDVSIAIWKLFASDLDLSDAKKSSFTSLHDCFVRELKAEARSIDRTPGILVSPCDAIVGACGSLHDTELIQAKGFPYRLEDLFGDPKAAEPYRDGRYATLRLTSTMYHRFHAPYDCDIDEVVYISGDTWNVNPIALRRVERLFCRNERAVLRLTLDGPREPFALVAVAAILVASIHLKVLETPLTLAYKGPNRIRCRSRLRKGEEIGHFSHGSTIIAFGGSALELCDTVKAGAMIRMGQPLMRHRP